MSQIVTPWQKLTGVIAVCNAVFWLTIASSSPVKFAIKSQKWCSWKLCFSAAKFFLEGRTPKIRCQNFYAPAGTHHVEKFGAIPPTDADDISQSTPGHCKRRWAPNPRVAELWESDADYGYIYLFNTRFLANFRILGVKKLLGTDRPPMRYALASVGHPVPTVKFLGGHAP